MKNEITLKSFYQQPESAAKCGTAADGEGVRRSVWRGSKSFQSEPRAQRSGANAANKGAQALRRAVRCGNNIFRSEYRAKRQLSDSANTSPASRWPQHLSCVKGEDVL